MSLVKSVSDHAVAASLTAMTATVAAIGTAAYLVSRPQPMEIPDDLENQSVIVDAKEGIRRSRLCRDGKLIPHVYPEVQTLYDSFQKGREISGNGPCVGWRKDKNAPYQWLTYNEVYKRAHSFGSGIINTLKQEAGNDTYIGIYAKNCPGWVITEQALYCFAMVAVPLYDTLGPESCIFIMNQTEMKVIICDTEAKALELISSADQTPHLRHIVVIQGVSVETRKMSLDKISIVSFEEILNDGKLNLQELKLPKADDLATICYTSGTTALPKGTLLTHRNHCATTTGIIINTCQGEVRFTSEDCHISYLPLAHVFERAGLAFVFIHGGRVGFYSGDIRNLISDMQALRPTLFCTVPRLLNRMYDKVQASIAGSTIKTKLFEWAVSSKLAEVRRGVIRKDSIWDTLIFSKIQNSLGGKVRLLLVGSAPLSEKVANFCRAALGCHFYEAYGQTESGSSATCTLVGEFRPSSVGAPLPINLIKLVDVDSMDIRVKKDGKGEVCIKGPNVTQGYFKNPEKTKEILDDDGWLHTGDIGMWLPNGTLKLVDRSKHIFKLAQGEYVAPEKVESAYSHCRHLSQVFVDGSSLRSCTVAVVVPDVEHISQTLKEEALALGQPCLPDEELTAERLCANETIRARLLKEMRALGVESKLNGLEQVKAIHLCPEPFTVENGLMTPTMKSRRPQLRTHFAAEIEALYRQLGE